MVDAGVSASSDNKPRSELWCAEDVWKSLEDSWVNTTAGKGVWCEISGCQGSNHQSGGSGPRYGGLDAGGGDRQSCRNTG